MILNIVLKEISAKFISIEAINNKMLKRDGIYSKVHLVSQTYFPGEDDHFQLLPLDKDKRLQQIESLKEWDESKDELVLSGIADVCKKNHQYKQLVWGVGLGSISNNQIFKIYNDWLFGEEKKTWCLEKSSFRYSLLIKNISYHIKDAALELQKAYYPINEISNLLNLDSVVWR